jgi:aryl-alcohol dehydrogenase-like predicted oxidoreductase
MLPTTLRLGDVEIARLVLGTNRLTNTAPNVAFIKAAVDAGVRMIDTAHLYTGGESERTIGTALAPDLARGFVATKGGVGGSGRGRPENFRVEIEESDHGYCSDCGNARSAAGNGGIVHACPQKPATAGRPLR